MITTALWLFLYGGALAWLAPPLLRRLTYQGVSPRFGVCAWIAIVGATLVAWLVALVMLIGVTTNSILSGAIVTLCLELFGLSGHTPMAGRIGSVALVAAGTGTAAIALLRTGDCMSRLRARSREHAHAAWVIGRPTGHSHVVVVASDRPAAYCVVGRPNAIVVTSAAMEALSPSQLEAVLAHERAHIAGRHHHILMLLNALADAMPRLPLFRAARTCVAELLEMCADDTAARRVGMRPLLGGLSALAGHHPAVHEGLGAAGTAVVARAQRLVSPTRRHVRWRHRLCLTASTTVMLATPALIQLLCNH